MLLFYSGSDTSQTDETNKNTKANEIPDSKRFTEKEINISAASSTSTSTSTSTPTNTVSNVEQISDQDKVVNEILTNQDTKEEKTSIISWESNQPTMWLGTEDKT